MKDNKMKDAQGNVGKDAIDDFLWLYSGHVPPEVPRLRLHTWPRHTINV